MTEMRTRDWTAAVRIAARDVAALAGARQPFYIGGYSTGGTLSLQYTLDALEDASLRRPDRVLLVSPAIELTRVAALASIIDALSFVPVPLLEKVRWQEITQEYDPYKFNSFPVNASRQVNRATKSLQESLLRASASGRLAQMPPVVTWQSVVDSTVGSGGVADRLYARLNGSGHRLVLFDVNRQQALNSVQRPQAGAMIERLRKASTATCSTSSATPARKAPGSVVRRLTPDGTASVRETELDMAAHPRLAGPRRPALPAGRPGLRLRRRQWPRRHSEHRLLAAARRKRRPDHLAWCPDPPAQQPVLVADRCGCRHAGRRRSGQRPPGPAREPLEFTFQARTGCNDQALRHQELRHHEESHELADRQRRRLRIHRLQEGRRRRSAPARLEPPAPAGKSCSIRAA